MSSEICITLNNNGSVIISYLAGKHEIKHEIRKDEFQSFLSNGKAFEGEPVTEIDAKQEIIKQYNNRESKGLFSKNKIMMQYCAIYYCHRNT
jgi:hypothetical protein